MSNKEYSGTFSWKITDPFAVSQFLQAAPGAKFSSDAFTIGGLRWQLYAYPRGRYTNPKWSKNFIRGCELYLQLISSSFPHNAHKIIFNYRLFCLNASSSFTNIQQFVRNQDHFVSWYKGTLTTNELEALEGQSIHLQCYINVLKIIAYDQKSVIYQFPFKTHKNEMEFEWKIKNINGLFINTKCGKHLESNIFDNFWCLRIAPKGWKLNQQKYVSLWLQLCCLPMNTSKINANYQIKCVETNTYYSNNASFDYNVYHKNASWDQKKLVTNILKHYDSLTFKCNIQILKKYDCNGFVIRNNNNYIAVDDSKSAEIDALKQEIAKLNKKMSVMHEMIKDLQSKIGISDDEKIDINILEMLKQTKKEIELLKNKNNVSATERKGHSIKNWLQNVVKLPEYFDLFLENGFEEMRVIKMLTGKELDLLGIQKLGHRMKILSAIKDLNDNDMHTIDAENTVEVNEGRQFYPSPGHSNYM